MNMATTTISAKNAEKEIALTLQVWKERSAHVAYCPELDLSSCGKTANQAKNKLREAISLFIEEAARMGTLNEILEESGFEQHGRVLRRRPILAHEKLRLTLPAA